MFSVIIPTMWRSKRTKDLLYSLEQSEKVGEIFLINNNSENTPDYLKDLKKITIFNSGKNEYVNPSWNIGVKNSKFDFIALCNDDINFNTIIFDKIKIMDKTLIGIDSSCYQLQTFNNVLYLDKLSTRCYGFGCLMFFKKQDYIEIPEQLKIWYGDDYLFDNFENIYAIYGLPILTTMSETCSDYKFVSTILQDQYNYSLIKNENKTV